MTRCERRAVAGLSAGPFARRPPLPACYTTQRDVVERQMAHAERNQVTAAYVHAEYLPQRREMMQKWADYLERLKTGAEVIPFSTVMR
jgi:hypothetical protein